ncbi:hypothetical protein O0L34_g16427 [Tuta absoluta]|nr:hypothetical protein O0L34_g16427 [Tuta absoluta]
MACLASEVPTPRDFLETNTRARTSNHHSHLVMEEYKGHYKTKGKKTVNKTKTSKKKDKDKKICEGGTCKVFLADLTRKLQMKRKHEEDEAISRDIVQNIIDAIESVTITVTSKKPVTEKPEITPVNIEQLQTLAPELCPRDAIDIPNIPETDKITPKQEFIVNDASEFVFREANLKSEFKIPKMPVVTSDVMKPKQKPTGSMHEMAVNTGDDHDVASEISKYVQTLKKISLIAEEFNQKTAKNLKEIVNSVQEDLIKKLEELQTEQRKKVADLLTQEAEKQAELENLSISVDE